MSPAASSPQARPEALSAVLSACLEAMREASDDAAVLGCLARVEAGLAGATGTIAPEPQSTPTGAYLAAALAQARDGGGALVALADGLLALDASLTWRMRGGADPAPEDLPGRIANAMVIGPGGLEARRDVWLGVSLLPPGAAYPEHSHAPEEVYLFLTPGRARHGDAPWQETSPGSMMHNTPHITHALEAAPDAPMLAVWVLHDPRHDTPHDPGDAAG
ncbi:dimethylsulfonioproprionate lyase family protein [Pseudoroseicyclus sp. CXY001]|uniref:dimethylsulfonioproprionate lyase family protein n=1 Tax=Pseudoroseicyclus sp. CXY001 TaxID=3242492 RepID=UPI00358DBBCD